MLSDQAVREGTADPNPPKRRNKGERKGNQYFEPGVLGRKTGVKVKENVKKIGDFDDIDDFFHSDEDDVEAGDLGNGGKEQQDDAMEIDDPADDDSTDFARRQTLAALRSLPSTPSVKGLKLMSTSERRSLSVSRRPRPAFSASPSSHKSARTRRQTIGSSISSQSYVEEDDTALSPIHPLSLGCDMSVDEDDEDAADDQSASVVNLGTSATFKLRKGTSVHPVWKSPSTPSSKSSAPSPHPRGLKAVVPDSDAELDERTMDDEGEGLGNHKSGEGAPPAVTVETPVRQSASNQRRAGRMLEEDEGSDRHTPSPGNANPNARKVTNLNSISSPATQRKRKGRASDNEDEVEVDKQPDPKSVVKRRITNFLVAASESPILSAGPRQHGGSSRRSPENSDEDGPAGKRRTDIRKTSRESGKQEATRLWESSEEVQPGEVATARSAPRPALAKRSRARSNRPKVVVNEEESDDFGEETEGAAEKAPAAETRRGPPSTPRAVKGGPRKTQDESPELGMVGNLDLSPMVDGGDTGIDIPATPPSRQSNISGPKASAKKTGPLRATTDEEAQPSSKSAGARMSKKDLDHKPANSSKRGSSSRKVAEESEGEEDELEQHEEEEDEAQEEEEENEKEITPPPVVLQAKGKSKASVANGKAKKPAGPASKTKGKTKVAEQVQRNNGAGRTTKSRGQGKPQQSNGSHRHAEEQSAEEEARSDFSPEPSGMNDLPDIPAVENHEEHEQHEEPDPQLARKDKQTKAAAVTKKPIPRARNRARSELPAPKPEEPEEDGGNRRSKRTRVPPLAYWKNERLVYEVKDPEHIGPMHVVKDVIRVADSDNEDARRKKRHPSARVKKEFTPVEPDITVLDYQTGKERIERIIATERSIDPRTMGHGDYRFEKIFSEGNFVAAGVLLLPKGSEKPNKNSLASAMIFVILSGQVEVTVHKNTFMIGTGSMFFVPRGNQYKVRNCGRGEARVFFCHAKEVPQSGESSSAS
ncbi:hypothetical protein HK104_010590 [Borealophlyctis nickersoniae]|nr:hypothetical protein HK104_010590 [Borealophlyctis nickersoniae]